MPDVRPLVLVVEDEALLLFSIADDLRDWGLEVLEAINAEQAIKLLDADSQIRLVFTDIDMPGSMDGLRLAAVIRDRWPPVRIIITSGKQPPTSDRMPVGGIFIPKPYSPPAIAAIMTKMLE